MLKNLHYIGEIQRRPTIKQVVKVLKKNIYFASKYEKNMNAANANLLNAVVLIAMGAWGYFGSITPSPTALIPVFFGIVLLVLTNSIRNEHKVLSHVAVVLTVLVVVALAAKPLGRALSENDTMAIVRIGAMIFTCVIALVYFIKSFMDARKSGA